MGLNTEPYLKITEFRNVLNNYGYPSPNGNTEIEIQKFTISDSERLANMCLVAATKTNEYRTDYALLAVDFTEIYNEYCRLQNCDFDDFWSDLICGINSTNKVYKSMDIGEKALLEKRFYETYRKYEMFGDFK